MKKLIYKGVLLLLIGIVVVSCKKDIIKSSSSGSNNKSETTKIIEGISTSHNVIRFDNVNRYKDFVESDNKENRNSVLDRIKNSGFKNYFSNTMHQNSMQKMDKFFGQLLNKDGIIQIGNYLYQIDDDKVYTVKCKDKVENNLELSLDELKSKNNNVKMYSTSDNVLILTQSNGNIEKCKEDGVGSQSKSVYSSDGVYSDGIRTTLRHSKFGIYFDLVVEVQALKQGGPMFTFVVKFNSNSSKRRYKRRCKSWQYTDITHQSMSGVNSYLYKISESAFKNYSKYDLEAHTETYPYNIVFGTGGNLISTSGWAEIRVNI